MRYGFFAIMVNFLSFYPPPSPPTRSPLTTRKIKILKKWENDLELASFYACLLKITTIWCILPETWITTGILSFLAIFCTFTLLTTWKIKILKKWEKHLQLSSFYTCLPKIRIIWCMLPEIWSVTDRIFIIFSHFLHFYAIKIFKKWKKLLEILPLFTYVPQMKTIWCLVPEI